MAVHRGRLIAADLMHLPYLYESCNGLSEIKEGLFGVAKWRSS